MLAMPGLRAFSLTAKRGDEGVSCDAHGIFVGGVPLLQPPSVERPNWTARPTAELNKELTARYRLPIDMASKSGALALIAAALNRRDFAMAAIAAVQMQIPDPPPLAKRAENPDEIARRARELIRSDLLKFWDPAKHPRAGVPPNPGQFTLVGDKPEPLDVVPDVAVGNPAHKPGEERPITDVEGGESNPPGVLELPLPGGSPGVAGPGTSPKPSSPVEAQPNLPFPGGLPQQRAPAAAADVSGQDSPTQVPARGGRLGNAATRAQNAAIAAELKNQGYTITGGGGAEEEEFIEGAGPGVKGGTFVDITAVNEATGETVRVQTVDTLADGQTPTSREQAAIARIREKYPNDELRIIPKR